MATPVTSTPTVATPTAALHQHHASSHASAYHMRPGAMAHPQMVGGGGASSALPLPPPSTPMIDAAHSHSAVDAKELQWLASGAGGSLGAAVHGVISWAQFVVKSLQGMWRGG